MAMNLNWSRTYNSFHNCQCLADCTNILFFRGRSMGKTFCFCTLSTFWPIIFFIIFMANYRFEKCWCVPFWGGGGYEKVYVLYTHLNVDNYGWPLTCRALEALFFETQKRLNHPERPQLFFYPYKNFYIWRPLYSDNLFLRYKWSLTMKAPCGECGYIHNRWSPEVIYVFTLRI